MKKKVCILTDFYEAQAAYSLNIICEEQITMLERAGYAPIAVAEDIFKPVRAWKKAEMRHIPSGIKRDNAVRWHDGWQDDVECIYQALKEALHDVDVVLTHDIIYQPAALWINMAARRVAHETPRITWLNWVHSATASQVWTKRDQRLSFCQRHFPNSKTVYPNAYSVPRVARAFNCELDDVAVVPHPTDVCDFLGFQERTKALVRDKQLLSADAILVYPVRLDRGKQVEYVIRTAAALKRNGISVRAVIVDFHSTGDDKPVYRKELQRLAVDAGLNEIECTFTSQFSKEWNVEVPRAVVRDLMLLCNVFVMPSKSETYSLITQEAGLCGAFLVLNFDFTPMRDIYGSAASYYQFSSNIDVATGLDGDTNTDYDDIDAYFHDISLRVAYELEHNPVLAQQARIRKTRNPDYIFKRFIEPLFAFRDG
jgi:glycosyltransferase involved in cell wall biosynthesis